VTNLTINEHALLKSAHYKNALKTVSENSLENSVSDKYSLTKEAMYTKNGFNDRHIDIKGTGGCALEFNESIRGKLVTQEVYLVQGDQDEPTQYYIHPSQLDAHIDALTEARDRIKLFTTPPSELPSYSDEPRLTIDKLHKPSEDVGDKLIQDILTVLTTRPELAHQIRDEIDNLRHEMSLVYSPADIQNSIGSELSVDQAIEVLTLAKQKMSMSEGITWDVLSGHIEELYESPRLC